MSTLFRRILCPIDFGRITLPALELAIKLARDNQAEIVLMYVVSLPAPADPAADVKQIANDELRAVARKWLEGNVGFRIVVRGGDPATEVVRAEQDFDADLVVMATHGRTGLEHMTLGSVAERVVRESTRPVMTIRPR
jgi:nucleotide-binding universal stress UspA family protein